MYFDFGGIYVHSTAEVEFTTSRQTLRDDAERVIGWTERWNLVGHLQASGPTAIATAAASLDAAYNNGYMPAYAGLFISAGVPSNNYWLASNTISGIKVVAPPGYPAGTRLEFVNDRTYVVSLEAEFINFQARNIVAYTETISQQGNGGQRLVALETRYDLPVIQKVSRATPVRLVQQGMAVGRFGWPIPPDPILPDYLNDAETSVVRTGPRLRGTNYENYQVQWSYVMNIAQIPAPAYPNKWPANL
jgi:hypothetical protein